jgi:nucleoside phosphorylase
MKRRRLQPEDYTIGWICALSVELDAATRMLDEEHHDLPQETNHPNLYIPGRISEHNIIIAWLPAGQTGTNSAATVAGQMKSKFPSIQYVLMVGIGGGVPSAGDIRLGDVVVSQPNMGCGGVVQYDFGKSTPNGFVRTGFLNAPPAILLSALLKIQANHIAHRIKLSKTLSEFSRLRDNVGHDVLFEPTYEHVGGPECDRCSKDRLVYRAPRVDQDIMVHYGTIASGNQVIKDGVTRDQLNSELGGVLCFEMEAAGLMNSFPCLVIRGICDYADSHKNKKWQPYAAATAAAYAKELLSVIPAADIGRFNCRHEPELLKLLPIVSEAAFNSYNKRHNTFCLDGTRVGVLNEIDEWASGESEQCIFWLHGMAGTGKSTIARTVAYNYSELNRLGASFFFSRGGGDLGHAGKFFTTIAWQLANAFPTVRRYICDAVAGNKDIARQTLRDQWNQLILQPLAKLKATLMQPSLVIVIDALDECEEDNDIRLLLLLLAEAKSLESIRLRIFVTSRPETPIRLGFRAIPCIIHHDLALHNVSRAIVDRDISMLLRVQFKEIRESSEYLPADWPGDKTIDLLVQKASGLFIYAATVCRFIKTNEQWSPRQLLEVSLPSDEPNGSQSQTYNFPSTSPTKDLDKMYMQILERSFKGVGEEKDKKKLAGDFKQVIGTIAILFEPLSSTALGKLLALDQETVFLKLRHLRSVLNVPNDENLPIRLLHPSFRDFLLDKGRCSDPLFWVDEKTGHKLLAKYCLQRLANSCSALKKDICNLQRPGILIAEVDASVITQHLPPELQYACQYWVQHLEQGRETHYDDGLVHAFLRKHLLHWYEALSLMGKTPQGAHAISLLESIVKVSTI